MKTKKNTVLLAIVAFIVVLIAVWFSFFAKESAPDFSQYPAGPERKAAFFSYFAPIVSELNTEIMEKRQQIQTACSKDSPDTASLKKLATAYRVDGESLSPAATCDALLDRVDIVPVSLALAQAANESAWGTSRFARQGNNFFGQWCFKKGCGIVPSSRDTGKTHEVADFRAPSDSVESYMLNINRHDAYAPLRDIRSSLRDEDKPVSGLALTWGLNKYSERGEEYGEELRSMINYNELSQYDETTP
ncbi:glucosaminidase domain-containing protein [Alteromonas halophila]|uniref:Glucosaminidase n=1 Tax=Alteromonas halophila TaxID=516698 RepID=A0A918JJP7_9ALTE|nr:glucosaminidase domain-containing protein [Alteromonas halophila]GGW80735.1 glucosaminidase [Alteromonas halophila]